MRKKKADATVEQVDGAVSTFETATVSDTTSEADRIKDFLETVLRKMNVCECSVLMSINDDALCLNITGEDTNGIIGYRGEVLDALQYLCNLLLNGKSEGLKRVVLDADGYRQKREKTLQRLAGNLEQKVKRTGRPAKLEPMNPYERRIIHTALQNSKYVVTESEGQGITRHIVISPKEQSNILNSPNAPRKTLNFVYRSDKKRR